MKKNLAATLLTLTTLMASMPMTAFASTQTINPEEQDTFEVVASANVTDEDLAELGMNVVVSIPTEIALSLNGSREFSGSDKIYAYGIMDSANSVSVTIDTDHAAYGKVKYRTALSGSVVESSTNFFSTVTENLSKDTFSADETKENYIAKVQGSDMEKFSELDVNIKNLIPTSGTGVYYTNVPLKIQLQ